MPTDHPQTPAQILVWTDTVHARDKQLYFWRLSFTPDYDRAAIFGALRQFYDQFHITSYVVYETLGDFDLLIRMWISKTHIPEEIQNALRSALRPHSVWDLNYIACRTDLHHTERHASHTTVEPPESLVRDDVIVAINDFNQLQLASQPADGFDRELLPANPPPLTADIETLIDEKLLKPIKLNLRGVRFYIVFDRPHRATPAAWEQIRELIMTRCENIAEDWEKRELIEPHTARSHSYETAAQLSVYSGSGTMSDFLVLGRAPYGYFHAFVKDVVHGLRRVGLDTYHMRPYTYVLADEMFSAFSERRPTAASQGFTDDMAYATEGAGLELKASFAINLERLREDGSRDRDQRMQSSVTKAIAGLLNSPDGGILLVGVLEVERAYQNASGKANALLTWLTDQFGYEPLRDQSGDLVHPLRNAILGVEHEYSAGSAYTDEDKYLAAIRDTLRMRIEPSPWPWLGIATRVIEGRQVVVLTVRPGDTWFFANLPGEPPGLFFIREGASTRAIHGSEGQLYRRAYRRPGHSDA